MKVWEWRVIIKWNIKRSWTIDPPLQLGCLAFRLLWLSTPSRSAANPLHSWTWPRRLLMPDQHVSWRRMIEFELRKHEYQPLYWRRLVITNCYGGFPETGPKVGCSGCLEIYIRFAVNCQGVWIKKNKVYWDYTYWRRGPSQVEKHGPVIGERGVSHLNRLTGNRVPPNIFVQTCR